MFNKKEVITNQLIIILKLILMPLIVFVILGCNSDGAFTQKGEKNEVRLIQIIYSPKTLGTSSSSIAKGSVIQFTATAIYTDNSKKDITDDVEWVSDTPDTLSIDNTGLALGKDIGQSIIHASLHNLESNTVTVDVTDAIITSIQVTPANTSLPKGQDQRLIAMATFSDATSQVVTGSVTWQPADTAIASVTPDGLLSAVEIGSTSIVAIKDGVTSNTAMVEVTDAIITSIQVTPANISLPKGQDQRLAAMATFSDATSQVVTESVTWLPADTAIASVTPDGLLSAVEIGSTSVVAVKDGVTSNTAMVEVTDAIITSIQVTPANTSLPKGQDQRLAAMATFSDGTSQVVTGSVTWQPADTAIASVTPDGLLSAVEIGSTSVVAIKDGVTSNTAMVEVTDAIITSIRVTPENTSLPKGQDQRLAAMATFSDGTSQVVTASVTWQPADTAIITVTPDGLLSAVEIGSTSIVAIKDGVTSNTVMVDVTNAILIDVEIIPSLFSLKKGDTIDLTIIGKYSDGATNNLNDNPELQISSINTDSSAINSVIEMKGINALAKNDGEALITVKIGSISKTINGVVCSTSSGLCLYYNNHNIDSGAYNVIATVTPSIQHLSKINYTAFSNQYSENGSFGPLGNFASFNKSESVEWCEYLAKEKFLGRSKWRVASSDFLQTLYNNSTNGLFYDFDWATLSSYHTDQDNICYDVGKNIGSVTSCQDSALRYISCISEQ